LTIDDGSLTSGDTMPAGSASFRQWLELSLPTRQHGIAEVRATSLAKPG
jgi:hypothetical protein